MYEPSNDPLPWVTNALTRVGAFDHQTDEVYDYRNSEYIDKTRVANHAAAALLDVLTNTVAALHDDAKAYRVVINKAAATAGTLLERRIVEVGSKPMNDDDISDGIKASVMMGLALHEVGHIRFSRAYKGAITRRFGAGKVTGAISTLSNLAADCHDEAEAMEAFPGLAPAIPVTLWWVGGKGQSKPRTIDLNESVQVRVNAAIAATRYPWQVDWSHNEAWLDWWREWAKRARNSGQPKVHAAIVEEAILKVRDFTPTPPMPEPPQDQPQPSPEPQDDAEAPLSGSPDMSDEPDSPEPEKPSEDGDDGQDGQTEDTIGSDGDEDEDGDEDGEGDEPSDHPGDEDSTATSTQGGLGDTDLIEDYMDALDEEKPTDDPCVKDAARDEDNDHLLQQAAETVTRGQREGMRRRVYKHGGVSYHEQRTVIAIPRKGKRWVYDV